MLARQTCGIYYVPRSILRIVRCCPLQVLWPAHNKNLEMLEIVDSEITNDFRSASQKNNCKFMWYM